MGKTGIILPDVVVLHYLMSALPDGKVPAELMNEVFDPDVYDSAKLIEFIGYFDKYKIAFVSGYPNAESKIPGVYVVPGSVNSDIDIFVPIDYETNEDGTKTEIEADMFKKTAKVICVADQYIAAVILSTVVQYLLMQAKDYFVRIGIHNTNISYPEFDVVQRYLPQNFFYRFINLDMSVADSYKADTHTLIRKIDIGVMGEDIDQTIPYNE